MTPILVAFNEVCRGFLRSYGVEEYWRYLILGALLVKGQRNQKLLLYLLPTGDKNPLFKHLAWLHIPRINEEMIQTSLAPHVLTILQRLLLLAQTTPSSPSLIHRPYLPQ